MNKCEHCGSYDARVSLAMEEKSMKLCLTCYNEIMSEELEVDVEPLVDSFSLKDYEGVSHTFNVERRIVPTGIFIEAVENIEFGYKFAVDGDLYCNQQELLNKLIEKARKGIREKQVETNFFPSGQTYNSIITDQITGLIEYDETSDGTPLVIIDGKPFTWEEVGKMVMSYEGFQIKVKMYDPTDDVE
jgi:predicted ribosome-associated RNA-binding protein Tma20